MSEKLPLGSKLGPDFHVVRAYRMYEHSVLPPRLEVDQENGDLFGAAAVEEIYGITYKFDGERLDPVQSVQRLYLAGFKELKLLGIGYAVMMGESGRYLKAWHANVRRLPDGTISRREDAGTSYMRVSSVDLGYCQFNVPTFDEEVEMHPEATAEFVAGLFDNHPEYADGFLSCEEAWSFYQRRGWSPWYAYVNKSYKRGLPSSGPALCNYFGMSVVGQKDLCRRS